MRDDPFLIEFRRLGTPTELWGVYNGFRWDFWAKYGSWEFRLSEDPAKLPEVITPDDAGVIKNGTFGSPTDEISEADALRLIQECIAEYDGRLSK